VNKLTGKARRAVAKYLDDGTEKAIVKRLKFVEAELHELRGQLSKIHSKLRQIQPGVDALVRARFIEADSLPYPERINIHRFRLYSQHQEDGLLWGLLQSAGISTHKFVELGSGLSGGNSAMLALELGWTGLMVDGSPVHINQVSRRFPRATAVAAWITPETVNDLISTNGFAGEVDFLSIDIDSHDYWVWEAVTACHPRVVCVEYNSMFGPERAVTIPYNPKFNESQHRFFYYGASLAALSRLAARKGYRLVTVEPNGVNAFFLRNDLAPEIPEVAPARAYRLLEKYDLFIKDKGVDVFAWAAENGRELVEIE
jgi:hypothetical protein